MLPAFHREHPGIEVRICEETTDQVERSLLSGRLDFAILHTGPDDGVTGNPALEFECADARPFSHRRAARHAFVGLGQAESRARPIQSLIQRCWATNRF